MVQTYGATRPRPHHRLRRLASFSLAVFFISSFSACLRHAAAAPAPENDGYSCRSNRPSFPTFAFSAQPDPSKVYLRIDELTAPSSPNESSSFQEAGLTKFASAFGVPVVGDEGVPDEKIVYVATLLAELLDVKEKGRPTNEGLAKSLRASHSMIVLVSNPLLLRKLSTRRYRPKELKCFSRAFHVAHHMAVRLDQSREDNCPEDEGKKDRAKGLVGDFLVSKGYPATYPSDEEIGIRMRSFFEKAKRRRWINTRASNCQSSVCIEIAFQSWALSSALGSDQCWCKAAKEWKFCTEEEMRRGFPELWGTLMQELMLDGKMQPDGSYSSPALA